MQKQSIVAVINNIHFGQSNSSRSLVKPQLNKQNTKKEKVYESNGKYAAWVDFTNSPESLLTAVIDIYEAQDFSAATHIFHAEYSDEWKYDYLENGLGLLGFKQTAELVKKDFAQSSIVFALEYPHPARELVQAVKAANFNTKLSPLPTDWHI